MKKLNNEKLKRIIFYFNIDSKRNRDFIQFESEFKDFKKLPDIELASLYVNTKQQYEYRKAMISVLIVSSILLFISNIWEKTFKFLEKSNIILNEKLLTDDSMIYMANKSLYILFWGLSAIITIFFIIIIISYIRETFNVYKKLLIIEEVRNER